MAVYKIADVTFELKTVFGYTPKLCEKYLYDGQPDRRNSGNAGKRAKLYRFNGLHLPRLFRQGQRRGI